MSDFGSSAPYVYRLRRLRASPPGSARRSPACPTSGRFRPSTYTSRSRSSAIGRWRSSTPSSMPCAKLPLLSVRGYRETRSVGMLTFDDADGRAAALATDLHERLAALGVYEPERRKWLPHVTVLRFRKRPGLRPVLPDLEPFMPSDAAAFLSRLRPSGAQYEVLESMAVGGR